MMPYVGKRFQSTCIFGTILIVKRMASKIIHGAGINSPKRLYKYLLRECEKLPKHTQQYYKHSVKQSFKQHALESDTERIQQIIERALLDAKWVIQKYNQPGSTSAPK